MNTIFKIRMLYLFLREGFDTWKTEVYLKDLDERFCCDGKECACGGSSVREMYTHIYLNKNKQ